MQSFTIDVPRKKTQYSDSTSDDSTGYAADKKRYSE